MGSAKKKGNQYVIDKWHVTNEAGEKKSQCWVFSFLINSFHALNSINTGKLIGMRWTWALTYSHLLAMIQLVCILIQIQIHILARKKKPCFPYLFVIRIHILFFLLAWFGFVLYSINVLHIFLRHNFNNKWYFRWFSVPINLSSYCNIIFDFFLLFPFFSFLSRCFEVICVDLSKFQWRDSFSFFLHPKWFRSQDVWIPYFMKFTATTI